MNSPVREGALECLRDGYRAVALWWSGFDADGRVCRGRGSSKCASVGKQPIARRHPRGLETAFWANDNGELGIGFQDAEVRSLGCAAEHEVSPS